MANVRPASSGVEPLRAGEGEVFGRAPMLDDRWMIQRQVEFDLWRHIESYCILWAAKGQIETKAGRKPVNRLLTMHAEMWKWTTRLGERYRHHDERPWLPDGDGRWEARPLEVVYGVVRLSADRAEEVVGWAERTGHDGFARSVRRLYDQELSWYDRVLGGGGAVCPD